MGLMLTLSPEGVRVEPRSAITAQARALILSHTEELKSELAAEQSLFRLLERVASHYRARPDEVELMKQVAAANPAAARESFEATIQMEGIR